MLTAAKVLQEHGIEVPFDAAGRVYTICPVCSNTRERSHQKLKCLGVTINGVGVHWGCNHCGWTGGNRFEKSNGHDRTITTYDYTDENGTLLFQKVRTPDKKFWQRRPDGKGGWINGLGDTKKVLYRLPELIEDIANDHVVLVVEGEKDVDNLRAIGVPATCNPDGAAKPGQRSKWRPEFSEMLRDARILIVPDHDDAGYAHADAIGHETSGVAQSVRILRLADHWPECPKGGDVSDWLAAGHTREDLDALIATAPDSSGVPDGTGEREGRDGTAGIQTAAALRSRVFDPLKFVVNGYITEGLTILAGRPKLGKSWFMLETALGTSMAGICLGNIVCELGDVLYLALEDNERRLQSRITKLIGYANDWPERLHYATEWPRADAGGLDRIRDWIKSVDNPRLVVVDVFAMFRSPRSVKDSPYESDYAAMHGLQAIASETGVAIVVVHHLRKSLAEVDPFEKVSGTLGLSGAADTVLVLDRDGNGATLYGRGRDIDEIETAVEFDRATCRWRVLGQAADVRRTDERSTILGALQEAGEPMSPADISAATGMPSLNVRQLLFKMVKADEVRKVRYGRYTLDPHNSDNADNTDEV